MEELIELGYLLHALLSLTTNWISHSNQTDDYAHQIHNEHGYPESINDMFEIDSEVLSRLLKSLRTNESGLIATKCLIRRVCVI